MQQLQAAAIPFCLQSWMSANVKFKSQMGRTREAPTPSPKTLSISGAKNEPTIFTFRVERGPCFQSLQSRRFEARRGRGHASRTKRGLWGLETV